MAANDRRTQRKQTEFRRLCFIPILFPLAWLFGAYGVGAVQALADVLTVALAVPIMAGMNRKIDAAMEEMNP